MRRKTYQSILLNGVLLIMVIMILLPVAYIFATSLKKTADIYSGALLFEPRITNYQEIFTGSRSNFVELTRNSLVVASVTAMICGVIGSLGAYSITRLRWSRWVNGGILIWLLFVNMMPPIVFVTPYYLWTRSLGIYDTPLAVVMAHVVLNMPLAVIMMTNFFAEVPKEMEEAAMIDGCNQFQAFMLVVVPMVRPGLAAMGVLVFVFSWKEFLFALSLTTTSAGRTIPVGIANFVQEFNIRYGEMAAGSFFAMIPALILVLFAQRHIIKGLTVGAVKG
ncbi:MAG: carbohydrate ABC transporter permease [Chloroflexota bacterium]